MQISRSINGIYTEVLVHSFGDRILALVTQLGKVGYLDRSFHPSSNSPPPTTRTTGNRAD
ncbi:hypothetical protein M407DRAFT_29822 [Tulasnella calospora MUT 4182]|uniref:Uncharacterized protein n=1 Tax=Tulasnella calospora MUT 4182 TaxID=1051891 RepID=A0A0C3LGH7_9AGAM|nr:hypothetical protein M407DRAFT_29822 [Tulasnella calospora MUT 4182]